MNLTIGSVTNLPDEELSILNRLVQVWQTKYLRNSLRYKYYSYKNTLDDLGISIPPKLQNVETIVGWPAKAVDALVMRSRFDGFTFSGEDDAVMDEIVRGNKLKTLYQQACRSELIGSCAFLTTSAGSDNEPPAIISAYSPMFAAGEWDRRQKRLKWGLTIIDTKKSTTSDDEEPIWVNLYTDKATWEIKKEDTGWVANEVKHNLGRPLMEALVFRPSLEKPFGMSRISRAVMSITDSAVREALRTEVGAEFYTAPQKYILGVDDDFLDGKTKWEAYIGAVLALTNNEDGEKPSVGMFSQGTMQPHTEYMRSLAARFSGETSIPISELGVIHDNPASAEAIYASKESLVCEAEDMNEINGAALCEIGKMALAIAKGKTLEDLDDNERSIACRFKNPAKPSLVSQADAMVKVISAIPWVAESDLALEELGFNNEAVRRLKSAKEKAKAEARIEQQMQADQQTAKQATMYEISSIIKSYRTGKISYNNAIVLFERIGVDEAEAKSILDDPDDIIETIDEAGSNENTETDPE